MANCLNQIEKTAITHRGGLGRGHDILKSKTGAMSDG